MAHIARMFTPAEAGVVSGLGRKAIDNAIDKKLLPREAKSDATPNTGGSRRKRRAINETDLVWIYLNSRAAGAIPRAARRELYDRLAANADAKQLRVSDVVILDVGAARRGIEVRAAALDRAKANIVRDREVLDGEPVFKGTRIPVYDIAASLANGACRERILAAYSLLTDEALDQARLYAEAFPPRGRPRGPARTQPPLMLTERKVVRRRPSG